MSADPTPQKKKQETNKKIFIVQNEKKLYYTILYI
jgi:hypothetical protein